MCTEVCKYISAESVPNGFPRYSMQWWTIFEAGDTMKDRPPEYSDDTTDGADGYFEILQKQREVMMRGTLG